MKVATNSKYRGVIPMAEGKFAAIVFRSGEPILLGMYDSEETAAIIWDTVMFAMFADFAVLNFPDYGPLVSHSPVC